MEYLIIFTAFVIKHFVVDFPLQTPYQWMNKGEYFHLGGIVHSGLHAMATYAILTFYTPLALILAVIDFLAHYHIDWLKVNINSYYGWEADKNPEFWWLLGLDQLLHYLTYVLIIWLAL